MSFLLIAIFFLYIALIYALDKKYRLYEGTHFRVYWFLSIIPIILLGTDKGNRIFNYLARPKRIWKIFGSISIFITLICSLTMVTLILFSFFTVFISSLYQSEELPPPIESSNIFLIPGINEWIPLYYGIIGFVSAALIHELFHVILCKVENVDVKSFGISFLLLPISIFSELDTDKLLKIPSFSSIKKMRILSAGIGANLFSAFTAFVLFFIVITSIAPISNIMITDVVAGSPADNAGLTDTTVIIHINDLKIENASEFYNYIESLPIGENIRLGVKKDSNIREVVLTPDPEQEGTISGVKFENVIPGMPSEKAGLISGMIITRIDDVPISNANDFFNFMSNTTTGQEITIFTHFSNHEMNHTITLTGDPSLPEGEGKGFLGISGFSTIVISRSTGLSVGEFPAKELLHFLQNIPKMMTGAVGWIILLVLPFPNPFVGSFQGFSGTLSMFYEPVGWAAPFGTSIFWIANTFLWIGWLNFYSGLFWSLPICYNKGLHYLGYKFDSGSIIKEFVYRISSKYFDENLSLKIAGIITVTLAVITLLLLIFISRIP